MLQAHCKYFMDCTKTHIYTMYKIVNIHWGRERVSFQHITTTISKHDGWNFARKKLNSWAHSTNEQGTKLVCPQNCVAFHFVDCMKSAALFEGQ
jgi:hypothetical protein